MLVDYTSEAAVTLQPMCAWGCGGFSFTLWPLVVAAGVSFSAAAATDKGAQPRSLAEGPNWTSDVRRLATTLPDNLVLNRPVLLSSLGEDSDVLGDGFKLADGDRGTSFLLGKGCAQTTPMAEAFVRIDFGREVPLAHVRMWTRTDSDKPGLYPLDLYLGNVESTWRMNLRCAKDIRLSRTGQPTTSSCLASGRYLWIVLMLRGPESRPLSLCEVEAVPLGPTGTKHMLQTVGEMFDLRLTGVALHLNDRVRIVSPSTVCGLPGSSTMDTAVLELTAPLGARSNGSDTEEVWPYVQIDRRGLYKVCWCGNVRNCDADEDFALQVATINVNGLIATMAGNGELPPEDAAIPQGSFSDQTPLQEPWGVAASGGRVFVSEHSGQRVRWLDLERGTMWVLCGQRTVGFEGDGGPARLAYLNYPMGLALDKTGRFLYIVESGSHRVRRVQVDGEWPQEGTIETIAGSRFRGYSGDGGPATDARLNQPTAATIDENDFLWIADFGNNVIRVVNLVLPVRVPGTNEFRVGIMVTAAGTGGDGLLGNRGDGAMSNLAQIGTPMALASGSSLLSKEHGRLPTAVYVTEEGTNLVRSITLGYQTYTGVITTLAGTGVSGTAVHEAKAEGAYSSQLRRPAGVAVDQDGVVYVSDTYNHRLLQLPVLEYVSLGCWRENIESPWIPSIEPQPGEEPNLFLDGLPEARANAIYKCAQAALQRGFVLFAVRQIGVCAGSSTAQLHYRNEGSSTSCANGRGGARDNSVYMFARPGMLVEQLGLVYEFVNRGGSAGSSSNITGGWTGKLNKPAGLAVNPSTKDLWIADSGNNRLRLLFHQVGPDRHHEARCTNGFHCQVELHGDGLQPNNRLAVIPLHQRCGEQGAALQAGFQTNPGRDTPSPSFTTKSYNLGLATLRAAGTFRLCYCHYGANVFGKRTDCRRAAAFVADVGTLRLEGPQSTPDLGIRTRAGLLFDVFLVGVQLSGNDRIRVVNATQPCGVRGAEVKAVQVDDGAVPTPGGSFVGGALSSGRAMGNSSVSLWRDLRILQEGVYRVCWCRGPLDEMFHRRKHCFEGAHFSLEVMSITVDGPISRSAHVKMGMGTQGSVVVRGRGLIAGDRIRIVDPNVTCGSTRAKDFSPAIFTPGKVPYSMPDAISGEEAIWSGVKVQRSGMLRVCWCGRADGCTTGADFGIETTMLQTSGPTNIPPQHIHTFKGFPFTLSVHGHGFDGSERVRVVDRYTQCGTLHANKNTLDMDTSLHADPSGPPDLFNSTSLRWRNVLLGVTAWYRICYCGCDVPGACCFLGKDFYVEVGSVFVDNMNASYAPRTYAAPTFPEVRRIPFRKPTIWGQVPKDNPFMVTVNAKTRDIPAWAGSGGPIDVQIFTSLGDFLPKVFTLNYLPAGGNISVQERVVIPLPRMPKGIFVRSRTTDAWFCEYIDVTIEGFGMNRFPCMSWSALPAHRDARLATMVSDAFLSYPALLPRPQLEMWESRYFWVDACGGCPVGFSCVQERPSLAVRFRRELPQDGRMSSTVHSVCKPVCGDGLPVAGEQCDDGNLRNSDGCSGQCQVEHGFECRNFADVASRCFPRLCDHRVSAGEQQTLVYGQALHDQGEMLGYMCSARLPLVQQPPMDDGYVCYPWQSTGSCPVMKTPTELQGFLFQPLAGSRVDCKAYEVAYVGPKRQCDGGVAFFGPLGEDGYKSYQACADECSADPRCNYMQFAASTGGKNCSTGDCEATCHLLEDCRRGVTEGGFHLATKVLTKAPELGGLEYVCSRLPIPKPAFAREHEGMVVVQMDSPTALPEGVRLGTAFGCSLLLTEESLHAVGGSGASCLWTSHTVLHILLGSTATLGYVHQFDSGGHYPGTSGSPSLLFFDSKRLLPLGVAYNYWARDVAEHIEIFVTRGRPGALRDGGAPRLPRVTLRGPSQLGGCGPLEVFADVSSMGGGRRWRSVTWTCQETRPDYRLSEAARAQMYDACANRIQPLLNNKPWCTGLLDPSAPLAVQPCQLKAIIPSTTWCGLSLVRLQVKLESADGYFATSEWTTDILQQARVPTASPAGSTAIEVPAQRLPGAPLPRLRLEVTTQSDAFSGASCSCNLTRGPPLDSPESQVVVEWYRGEVRDGIVPRIYEMQRVLEDENPLVNVLEVALKGTVLRPMSAWRYVARVAYAARVLQEAAIVPFTVTVGPIRAPKAHLVAPVRVNNDLCTFVVDATGSQLLDLLFWTSRRLGSVGDDDVANPNADLAKVRSLQASNFTAASPTPSPPAPTPTPLTDTAQSQGLKFRWEIQQLLRGVDDGNELLVTPKQSAINSLMQLQTPTLEIPQRELSAGLYVFKVQVSDSAFPNIVEEASATVEIFDQQGVYERSVTSFRAPSGLVRASDGASVEFWQSGFGSCPTLPSFQFAALILLRSVDGLPAASLQPYMEVPLEASTRPVKGKVDRDAVAMKGTANVSIFQPGFQYAYRLLSLQGTEATRLASYKDELLRASPEYAYLPPNLRMVRRETPPLPLDLYAVDTEPFSIYSGPRAGTLQLLEPANGRGTAMQDLFHFQQVWATDHPPLQHSFLYGQVPEERRAALEAAMSRGFGDAGSDELLMSLVEGEMVAISDWSEDPTLSTPMPSGMFVFEGRVRDAIGIEARRMVAINVFSSWKTQLVYAADRLVRLDMAIQQSRMTILQIRAANRGAVAVVPLCAAVKELPDWQDYDFLTMLEWNATSGIPNPSLDQNQPIYGKPVVPTATRDKVIAYLHEVLDAFQDVVGAMASTSLTNKVRRLQGTENKTPTQVQVLAQAFRGLAESIAPILDTEVFVRIAKLVSLLVTRVRAVGGDLNQRASTPQDLLHTLAAILTNMARADLPRPGKIEVNASTNEQVRLSYEVLQATEAIADALAAFAQPDRPQFLVAELPSREGLPAPRGDGPLQLTVLVRRLQDVITSGITLMPDTQASLRWPYPVVEVDGFGPPGFQAQTWAAGPTQYGNAVCKGAEETFLERIVVMSVSWPRNPVMYSEGSLVGTSANITLPYSLQLRSCGVPLVVKNLPTRLRLSFRLNLDLVRERRWGYHGATPYRVSWWEDLPAVSEQESGIRRWTTHGCSTQWQRQAEDIVNGRCDRFPGIQAGSIIAVELRQRPAYILQPEPPRNAGIHNIVSWLMLPLALWWLYYWLVAGVLDKKFWPTEKHFVKIHFAPLEHQWRETVRRGRQPFPGLNLAAKIKQSWAWRMEDFSKSLSALSGTEVLLSLEVRELRCMRSGRRNATYQNFFDAVGERDRAGKMASLALKIGDIQQEQLAMSEWEAHWESTEPPPPPPLQELDYMAGENSPPLSRGSRRAAWPDLMDSDLAAAKQAASQPDPPPELNNVQPPQQPPEQAVTLAERQLQEVQEPSPEAEPEAPPSSHASAGQEEIQQQLVAPTAESSTGQLALASSSALPGDLPPPWREVISESHGGRVYYYNPSTGESTWDRSAISSDGSLKPLPQNRTQQQVTQNPVSPGAQTRPARPKKLGTLRSIAQAATNNDPASTMDEDLDRLASPHRGKMTKINVIQHSTAVPQNGWELLDVEDNGPSPQLHKEPFHGAPPVLALGNGDLEDSDKEVRAQVERSLKAAAESRDIMLPAGWAIHTNSEGRDFYMNMQAGISQWEVPRLPQHWEERVSSDGKVYYLCLFDGRTQWEWPAEPKEVDGPGFHTDSQRLLALPGGTEPLALQDARSEAGSDVSSKVEAVDQFDPSTLLSMQGVKTTFDDDHLIGPTEPETTERWGEDKADKDWKELKVKLQMQKAAQERQFHAANKNPGVREFIRPHEIGNLTNNWDRQLDTVTMRADGQRREHQLLGFRAELAKDELRTIFPIIQRLHWTKWTGLEIFWHSFQRARPTQCIYANVGKPTKKHRAYIHGLFISAVLLASNLMAIYEAPVREDVTASMRSTLTILVELVTMPFQLEILWVAPVADLLGRIVKHCCHQAFFTCSMHSAKPPFLSEPAKREQMRYWHEMAELGKWVCMVGMLLNLTGTLAICSLLPQPRAASVARAFFVAVWLSHLLLPLLEATLVTVVLSTARTSGAVDGFLTVFPGTMDFLAVGVKTPEFLSWRVQRMVSEQELLAQVYPNNLPRKATKVAHMSNADSIRSDD